MFATLPTDARPVMDWPWQQLAPFYEELAARALNAETVADWLRDWTRLDDLVSEAGNRLSVARTADTTDKEVEQRYNRFIEQIEPATEAAEQRLRQKLLGSGLEPQGMAVPLRSMRADAALFRDENLPLYTEEQKLSTQYDTIVGAQTLNWEGEQITLPRLRVAYESPDRARRERAWWLAHERQLADREALNGLWRELLALRQRVATNAGFTDYRDYSWPARGRFDYTPQDCGRFHDAIAAVCVPAATRVYERHRQRLGLATLRPWDLSDGWFGRPAPSPGVAALKPFEHSQELATKSVAMLRHIDGTIADQLQTMIDEDLLDLDNRPGKGPGGYCTYFATTRRPFIFMNTVGVPRDVQVLLHEAGHAAHAFAAAQLPYSQQRRAPMEFNEVASTAMELLAAPYLAKESGGFYDQADAAHNRVTQLEDLLLFWPFMAVVDAFQHWAYTNATAASNTDACDGQWRALWQRFMPAVDWSGLEAELVSGWQRKLHIFKAPFYYVEYGLAQLGAVQVWRNALRDQQSAVDRYRQALTLGGTATLPELYTAAGASLSFDAGTLGAAVALMEETIAELDNEGAQH